MIFLKKIIFFCYLLLFSHFCFSDFISIHSSPEELVDGISICLGEHFTHFFPESFNGWFFNNGKIEKGKIKGKALAGGKYLFETDDGRYFTIKNDKIFLEQAIFEIVPELKAKLVQIKKKYSFLPKDREYLNKKETHVAVDIIFDLRESFYNELLNLANSYRSQNLEFISRHLLQLAYSFKIKSVEEKKAKKIARLGPLFRIDKEHYQKFLINIQSHIDGIFSAFFYALSLPNLITLEMPLSGVLNSATKNERTQVLSPMLGYATNSLKYKAIENTAVDIVYLNYIDSTKPEIIWLEHKKEFRRRPPKRRPLDQVKRRSLYEVADIFRQLSRMFELQKYLNRKIKEFSFRTAVRFLQADCQSITEDLENEILAIGQIEIIIDC